MKAAMSLVVLTLALSGAAQEVRQGGKRLSALDNTNMVGAMWGGSAGTLTSVPVTLNQPGVRYFEVDPAAGGTLELVPDMAVAPSRGAEELFFGLFKGKSNSKSDSKSNSKSDSKSNSKSDSKSNSKSHSKSLVDVDIDLGFLGKGKKSHSKSDSKSNSKSLVDVEVGAGVSNAVDVNLGLDVDLNGKGKGKGNNGKGNKGKGKGKGNNGKGKGKGSSANDANAAAGAGATPVNAVTAPNTECVTTFVVAVFACGDAACMERTTGDIHQTLRSAGWKAFSDAPRFTLPWTMNFQHNTRLYTKTVTSSQAPLTIPSAPYMGVFSAGCGTSINLEQASANIGPVRNVCGQYCPEQ